MPALTEDDFRSERQAARREYNKRGRLLAPWLAWRPDKTIADLWNEAQERHKDPAYMTALHGLQAELDADAKRIRDAVTKELELRKLADEYRERQKAEAKKTIGRRYARVPTGKRR